MFRIISAVLAAALAAALFVVLTAVAPQVNAGAPREEPAAEQPSVDDSLPVRAAGAACSQRAWPYFTRDCLLGPNATTGDIRLIALDRVDTRLPLVTSDGVVLQ